MTDKRATVLIVDDEPQNLHLLVDALRMEHELIVATSGREAIERVDLHNPPDLILLDVVMPEMDGWDVCRKLKANPMTEGIPIIFVTSRDEVVDEAKGLAAGAVDYITKPFSPEIVRARVRTHLTLKSQADTLASLSNIDDLTGMPNRRHFNRCLEEEWRRATRTSSPVTLVMMDVDHFKQYNDNYGHGAGDECLRRVAQALGTVIHRTADMVARYGGEEFAAILPATDEAHGMQIAERFRQAVNALGLEHGYSSTNEFITISVGVATCVPQLHEEPHNLLQASDRMLYEAKGRGRNCVAGGHLPDTDDSKRR
ncbi:MAG: diguanylate cyclase [Candidatus Thiodiazotropha sp. 6PLUC2]